MGLGIPDWESNQDIVMVCRDCARVLGMLVQLEIRENAIGAPTGPTRGQAGNYLLTYEALFFEVV